MCRDGPFKVDAVLSIFFEERSAYIRVEVEIEWLELCPQRLQVLLEGRSFIQRTPESTIVSVTC